MLFVYILVVVKFIILERLLMYIKNSNGLSIEFWGILYLICLCLESILLMKIIWDLFERYDLNYFKVCLWIFIYFNLISRRLWLIVLKVFLRFKNKMLLINFLFILKYYWFVRLRSVVIVEWRDLNLDWCGFKMFFLFK